MNEWMRGGWEGDGSERGWEWPRFSWMHLEICPSVGLGVQSKNMDLKGRRKCVLEVTGHSWGLFIHNYLKNQVFFSLLVTGNRIMILLLDCSDMFQSSPQPSPQPFTPIVYSGMNGIGFPIFWSDISLSCDLIFLFLRSFWFCFVNIRTINQQIVLNLYQVSQPILTHFLDLLWWFLEATHLKMKRLMISCFFFIINIIQNNHRYFM